MRVEVLPYNPRWASDFALIKANLEAVLEGFRYSSVEHVGSTSVPGMWAKPIIDVDIIVQSESDVSGVVERLVERAKYTYAGEMGIPHRHAMRASDKDPHRNVYVCVDGSIALKNHIGVRDTLLRDEQLREEYIKVKKTLAGQEFEHIGEYVEGKSDILQKILEKAGLGERERNNVKLVNKAGLHPLSGRFPNGKE